ncbi:hypothetical protein [Neobacillus dielmonensis]|uniref:hypothetical protein n=1 Tax=Neobacillus dielmonensis TaxID=1347369 RepID=UPI0005A75FF2|nr:hypothetical protein [Neobacillus dielmonensis]
MSAIKCTILNDQAPIRFAKEELHKYAERVPQPIDYVFVLGMGQDFFDKGLIEQPILQDDAFQVIQEEKEIYIVGSNPRSVLFGVYAVCKQWFGYKWVHFFSKEKVSFDDQQIVPIIHKGKMKRRGLVVENYDDPDFLVQLIDWAAKHYVNELFFTFMLWDKVKPIVEKEITKRGLSITLGGHSMHYLLKESSVSEKTQINFADDTWKDRMIHTISEYCAETSSIERISLWPADIGIEDDQPFLARYMAFTEQIQKQLPHIQVEHIAYNAGLSWKMLELTEEVESSSSVNTLFAYWGRNYQQSFTNEARPMNALQKWRDAATMKQRELTVFEYYSDHFMLGDLFPPLFNRIHEDIELFYQLGIENLVNLIVPYVPKEHAKEWDVLYPWKEIQLMNGYYFARLSWGDQWEEVEKDFYSIFEEHQTEVKQALEKLEVVVSEVSKWNVPLFPNRIMDPEKVKNHNDIPLILHDLTKWKNHIQPLNRYDVKDIADPYTMVSFYLQYVTKKLEDYISLWNGLQGDGSNGYYLAKGRPRRQ